MLQLPQIEVSGAPRALGRGQGEALREAIQRFVDVRFGNLATYLAERATEGADPIPVDAALEISSASLVVHRAWDAEAVEEHEGIAEGADVDPVRLYAAAMMTDMRDVLVLGDTPADEEGCTAAMVPQSFSTDGLAVAGQTWDLNKSDVEFIVGIHRKPQDGLQTWSLTCGGCLTLVGMNSSGLSMGTTNIKTYGARPGVGYLGVLHKAIRQSSAEAASKVVESAPVAGAHTFWLADATEQIEWEVTPDSRERRDTSAGALWRTNHCLTEAHSKIQGEETSESSAARFARMTALMTSPLDFAGLKAVFSDRADGDMSINRHAQDHLPTATNGVVIAVPGKKTIHACRGPADQGEWVSFRFDDA